MRNLKLLEAKCLYRESHIIYTHTQVGQIGGELILGKEQKRTDWWEGIVMGSWVLRIVMG